jgi:hypothetical protein
MRVSVARRDDNGAQKTLSVVAAHKYDARMTLSGGLGCFAALLTIGCAGHLYDAGNDQLAREMQKTYHDLHIADSVEDERKAASDMLATELDAARRFGDAMRDNRLAVLFDMPVARAPSDAKCEVASSGGKGTLTCEIDVRLQFVGGKDAAGLNMAIAQMRAAADAQTSDLKHLETLQLSDAEHKAIDFACNENNVVKIAAFDPRKTAAFQSRSKDVLELFYSLLQGYARAAKTLGPDDAGGSCTQWLFARKVAAGVGGLLAAAADTQTRVAEALGRAQAAADALGAKYGAARKKYEDAKATKTDIAKAKEELSKVVSEIDKYVSEADDYAKKIAQGLTAVKVFGNPVQLLALQTKVELLTGAVRAVFGKAEAAYKDLGIEALVSTVDTVEQADADKVLPGLLLESQIAADQLAVEQAAMDAARAELSALDDRVAALQRALALLVKAQQSLNTAGCDTSQLSMSVGDALTSHCGRGVAASMLHYANAFTIGLTPARAAQLRYIGAIDAGSLAQTAAVMKAWDDVLGIPIDLLARYHAGGIKPEAMAELIIQAAGFALLTATTGVLAFK